MSEIINEFKNLKQKDKLLKLRLWDIEYYENDNPSISDEEYDACVTEYNSCYKKPYTSSLGKANSKFEKYEHPFPVLSLDKVTDKETFEARIKEFDYQCVVQPKLDGLTVVYYPNGKIVSRGDGHIGEVLPFANFAGILPPPTDYPVRMEAIIRQDDYREHFADSAKNARNLAAGILRRKEYTEDIKYIHFYAYNLLGADDMNEIEQLDYLLDRGFNIPENFTVTDEQRMKYVFRKMEAWSKEQEYNTDGVVIKANVAKNDKDYGSTSHHPNSAFAYKFVSKVKETTLTRIEWSPGRNKFTPVAIFDTIELGGAAVSRASLHNLNIIKKLGVKIGSKIKVTLKNEIIPQIISSNCEGEEIGFPKVCPFCGGRRDVNSSDEVFCPNPECSLIMLDTMNKLVSKQGLDITGISEELVKKIFDFFNEHRYKINPFSILEFYPEYMVKNLGLTEYMAAKLGAEIKKKSAAVKFENFLYACNIPGVGLSTAKDIARRYSSINEFLEKWQDTGMSIEGIGEVTFNSISDNLNNIRENMKYIHSFAPNKLYQEGQDNKGIIVITGKLSKPKSYYQELIEKAGFSYSDSFNKDITYLVAADPDGKSSKLEKARKNSIPILSEQELLELVSQ